MVGNNGPNLTSLTCVVGNNGPNLTSLTLKSVIFGVAMKTADVAPAALSVLLSTHRFKHSAIY